MHAYACVFVRKYACMQMMRVMNRTWSYDVWTALVSQWNGNTTENTISKAAFRTYGGLSLQSFVQSRQSDVLPYCPFVLCTHACYSRILAVCFTCASLHRAYVVVRGSCMPACMHGARTKSIPAASFVLHAWPFSSPSNTAGSAVCASRH